MRAIFRFCAAKASAVREVWDGKWAVSEIIFDVFAQRYGNLLDGEYVEYFVLRQEQYFVLVFIWRINASEFFTCSSTSLGMDNTRDHHLTAGKVRTSRKEWQPFIRNVSLSLKGHSTYSSVVGIKEYCLIVTLNLRNCHSMIALDFWVSVKRP